MELESMKHLIFHRGSGLGNQLHRYVGVRCLALDKGEDFGVVAPDLFKGASFMNLDMGHTISDYHIEEPAGKVIASVETIDGEFQDERVWKNHLPEVREWLKVEPMEMPEDLCVVYIRGGEYRNHPELYLTKEYWDKAISYMRINHKINKFIVVSDDPVAVKEMVPDLEFIDDSEPHDMGRDWRMIRYAHWLILPNSSFSILPAYLNENVKDVIVPYGWARRNLRIWGSDENRYSNWTYI